MTYEEALNQLGLGHDEKLRQMFDLGRMQRLRPEPPPWWPAVENILKEHGLSAIDFVADFKSAMNYANGLSDQDTESKT